MAPSAAKASSMAALLLVVAVLVGACATGAYADGSGTVDLVNTCANDSIILIGEAVTDILVKAGQTAGINLSFLQGRIGPLYIRKSGVIYVITPDVLKRILGLTGVLYKIEIACDGECGLNILTIKPYAQVYVNGVPIGPPVTLTLCVDVVVPVPVPSPVP